MCECECECAHFFRLPYAYLCWKLWNKSKAECACTNRAFYIRTHIVIVVDEIKSQFLWISTMFAQHLMSNRVELASTNKMVQPATEQKWLASEAWQPNGSHTLTEHRLECVQRVQSLSLSLIPCVLVSIWSSSNRGGTDSQSQCVSLSLSRAHALYVYTMILPSIIHVLSTWNA